MNTHSWQQIKTHVDTHTHTLPWTHSTLLSCSSLMRRCCRKLLHCRADLSGSTTKPARNSAILHHMQYFTHLDSKFWAYSSTSTPRQIDKPLRRSGDESKGVNEKERLIKIGWIQPSLSPPGLDQPQNQSPEGNLISDVSDNIKSQFHLLHFQSHQRLIFLN